MAVITKNRKLAYIITFFISWKIPGTPETAKIAKFGQKV